MIAQDEGGSGPAVNEFIREGMTFANRFATAAGITFALTLILMQIFQDGASSMR